MLAEASLRSVMFVQVQDVTLSPPAMPTPNPREGTVSDCVNGVALSPLVSDAVVLDSPVAFQITIFAPVVVAAILTTIVAVVPLATVNANRQTTLVAVPSAST